VSIDRSRSHILRRPSFRAAGPRCTIPSLCANSNAEVQEKKESSGKLIHVKGLPASIDEYYLEALFKTYGAVTWVRMSSARADDTTRAGFVLFSTEAAAAAALADMNGAEVCGTENCTHVSVDLGNSQDSASELASQRLLSRLRAVKRDLRLHQRTERTNISHSHKLQGALPPPLTGAAMPVSRTLAAGSSAAAQGKALPDVDVNEKFNEFLLGLRGLLPQSMPTAHASISNVSSLGLSPRWIP